MGAPPQGYGDPATRDKVEKLTKELKDLKRNAWI